jgi:uncharacterized membrane protein
MIKNYYYLVSGALAILFAFTHSWNGQNSVLPLLDTPAITQETRTVFTYIWNIITAENFVFGIAFLIMSQYKDLSKIRFAALVISALLIARLIAIIGATLLYNPNGLNNTLVDSVAIVIYVVIIIFGTRVKDSGSQI